MFILDLYLSAPTSSEPPSRLTQSSLGVVKLISSTPQGDLKFGASVFSYSFQGIMQLHFCYYKKFGFTPDPLPWLHRNLVDTLFSTLKINLFSSAFHSSFIKILLLLLNENFKMSKKAFMCNVYLLFSQLFFLFQRLEIPASLFPAVGECPLMFF